MYYNDERKKKIDEHLIKVKDAISEMLNDDYILGYAEYDYIQNKIYDYIEANRQFAHGEINVLIQEV